MLFLLSLVIRTLARALASGRPDDGSKDLEILVLRHQVRVLRRKAGRPRLRPLDRVLLALASRVLPRDRWGSFIVTPSTLLRWHRELVRRKWTFGRGRRPGRPPLDPEVKALVLQMARENSRWGCVRISGELRKLGIRVGATTIRTLLRRNGLGPAPRRNGPSWSEFLRAQARGILACDFFIVETIRCKTLYALFFIELGSRRVQIAGVSARPDSAWVAQQARNLALGAAEGTAPARFLIHDRDAKFSGPFEVRNTSGWRPFSTASPEHWGTGPTGLPAPAGRDPQARAAREDPAAVHPYRPRSGGHDRGEDRPRAPLRGAVPPGELRVPAEPFGARRAGGCPVQGQPGR